MRLVCALRSFYGVTIGQGTMPERIPYAREPHKLQIVLSAEAAVKYYFTWGSNLRASLGLSLAAIPSRRIRVDDKPSKGRDALSQRH